MKTLSELQVELQEVSGRLDFSSVDLTAYLNKGVKFLDELSGIVDFTKMHFVKLEAGDNAVKLPSSVRSISSVYLLNIATGEKIRLVKSSLSELRDMYNTFPTGSDVGVPTFYTYISTLLSDHPTGDKASYYGKWSNFLVDDRYDIDGLLLYAAADREYSLEISGNFYTPPLTDTRPTNFWSAKHPELVIEAAMFKIDVNYRNTMGAKELLSTLSLSVGSIYHDRIEAELEDTSLVMEG